jgi:hypothetical protein
MLVFGWNYEAVSELLERKEVTYIIAFNEFEIEFLCYELGDRGLA